MKNFKTIITVIAISLSTVFSTAATEKNPTETKKDLREVIQVFRNDMRISNYLKSILVSNELNDFNVHHVLTITYDLTSINYKKILSKKKYNQFIQSCNSLMNTINENWNYELLYRDTFNTVFKITDKNRNEKDLS